MRPMRLRGSAQRCSIHSWTSNVASLLLGQRRWNSFMLRQPVSAAAVVTASQSMQSSLVDPSTDKMGVTPTGRIHVVSAAKLPTHHRHEMARLTRMLRSAEAASRSPTTPEDHGGRAVFVVCSMHCEAGDSSSSVEADVKPLRFTGVNYALHSHINGAGGTLRGILKGCAEQNALGAVAAGGHPYAAITRVFLVCSISVGSCECSSHGCHEIGCCYHRVGALFPCAECWRHLLYVAQLREMSMDGVGVAPSLQLLVWVGGMDTALHVMSIAQKRLDTVGGAVDITLVTS